MRKSILISFFLLLLGFAKAQFYLAGTESGSTKWNYIGNDTFKIIYPLGFDSLARTTFAKFGHVYSRSQQTMQTGIRPIQVLLHPYTVYSNGWMSPAPWHMELLTTPSQTLFGGEYINKLVVHELRHTLQMDKIDIGFTHAMRWLGGDAAHSLVLGLYVPQWYLEGDAVLAETMYSRTGRGRLPAFEMPYRALMLEKGVKDYDRTLLGSYKTYIPNHYITGFQIVAANTIYNRKGIFEEKLTSIGATPWCRQGILPFRSGRKGGFFDVAVSHLDSLWRVQDAAVRAERYKMLPVGASKRYESFTCLKAIGPNLLVQHTGFDLIPEIGLVDSGMNYKSLVQRGVLAEPAFSANGRTLVWASRVQHPRWEMASSSDLFAYDMVSGRTRRITTGERLFAPDIHPVNDSILAVRYDLRSNCHVVMLSGRTGQVIKIYENVGNAYLIGPKWSPDGKRFVVIENDVDVKRMVMVEVATGKKTVLLDAATTEISSLAWRDEGTVLFTGGFSGISNIYALDVASHNVSQMTNARFGADYVAASPSSGIQYFSNYTSDGYKLSEYKAHMAKPLETVLNLSNNFAAQLRPQFGTPVDFSVQPQDTAQLTTYRYRKLPHAVNFHSWAWGSGVVNNQVFGSAAVLSQNILGNTVLTGYYDGNPGTLETWKMSLAYYGWFPVIKIDASSADFTNRFNNVNADVSVPLQWNRLAWDFGIKPFAGTQIQQYKGFYFHNFSYGVSAYVSKQRAYLDLYSPLSVSGSAKITTDNGVGDRVLSLNLNATLPGVTMHHHILLGYSVATSDGLLRSLGYTALRGQKYFEMARSVSSVSFDYRLPLACTDWSMGRLMYIKRLSGGVFAEGMRFGDFSAFPANYKPHGVDYARYLVFRTDYSVGGSLYADMNFWRYEYGFKLGMHMGYNQLSKAMFVIPAISLAF